jgi:hypothetical protein
MVTRNGETKMKWFIFLVIALLCCLPACSLVPTTGDLRHFPTRDEVRQLALQEQEFHRDLISGLSEDMAKQHALQTPEKAGELAQLAAAFKEFAAAAAQRVQDLPAGEGPWQQPGDILESMLTVLGTIVGIRFLPSRAAATIAQLSERITKVEAAKA